MIVRISGLDVYYEVTGEGKDIVLLHGWGSNGEIFKDIVNHLNNNYRVWTIDLPGFGNTPLNRPFKVFDYMALLREFLVENNIIDPIILGHSFGGRVLIKYASSFHVSKIVLVDSAGIKPKRGIRYYFNVYLYKILKRLRVKTNMGSSDFKNASDDLRKTLTLVVNEDLKNDMRQIKSNTLIIWGEDDEVTPLKDGRVMEGLIKNSGLAIIPKSKHFPFIDNRPYFLLVLDSFLSSDTL